MPWGDVRGVLQYVPQFRGKTFVVVIDCPSAALAGTILDCVSLQAIGVKLVLASTVHPASQLMDLAVEAEMKVETQTRVMSEDSHEDCLAVLERGQCVLLDIYGGDPWDTSITRFVKQMNASKLIYLHTPLDVLPVGATLASAITQSPREFPKALVHAADICQAGVPRVHLLDANASGVLLNELFSNEGAGTMVYADSYRAIRSLKEEDIVELLSMIGRSVRSAHLVPRNYADIVSRIEDYSVLDIDGNVVGCVAVHPYPDEKRAELACLYVKQAHENRGYGVELARHAESVARQAGLNRLFALTNRAAKFFQSELGYDEIPMEDLPPQRLQQLIDSGRDSRVFENVL